MSVHESDSKFSSPSLLLPRIFLRTFYVLFHQNHEEHEQRWAKGSFLQAIRKNVAKLNPATLKLPWNIWLSMNPESDATAIWLERKFDVPASGAWASETVFSIPLSSAGGLDSVGYPGLIVFECTPLGDVTDELEK